MTHFASWLWAIGLIMPPAAGAAEARPPSQRQGAEISVGVEEGDLRGSDNRALQAAVDQVAGLGGGTVHIGAGHYAMRNALVLRSNVTVVGVPGKTVLKVCDLAKSLLTADGDCRERQITLADPSAFRVGDGVMIRDENNGSGFEITTATLTAKVDDNTFRLSSPLYLDYLVEKKATALLVFPVIGGWQIQNAAVEGITIEGNGKTAEPPLDGCRGGGIYLFESDTVAIRDCVVRRYNGDAISFQVCNDVTVEDCVVEENTGLGLHPGSGSQRPIVRRNRSLGNANDGLYVCWRVKHGLFEKNEVSGNKGSGISIGHKDTDNLFRENSVTRNAKAGVFFREESEAMGAHRNVFEKNVILDNGSPDQADSQGACVLITGAHNGLVFRDNTLGNSQSHGPSTVGISVGKLSRDLVEQFNRFQNLGTSVEHGK